MSEVEQTNCQDLFEIAVINSRPKNDRSFDWLGFDPKNVKDKDDLPPYLVFGPLDLGTLVINGEGWYAQWTNPKQKAKIVINWRRDTGVYTLSQIWLGEEGSACEESDKNSFPQVIASLYKDGFPANWDEKAKVYFEKKYQISWLSASDTQPCYFGLPDGVFRVLCFPVMIKNIRHAQQILAHISEEGLKYGFFALAQLTPQKIYYEVGVAPDWTRDAGLLLTQSIGETGLIPSELPTNETVHGKEYVALSREVMMLQVNIPFADLEDMLERLEATPMPIEKTDQVPLRRDLVPVVVPQSMSEVTQSFTVQDPEQGINVVTACMKLENPFDVLIRKNSARQLEELEKFSDDMLDKLEKATSEEQVATEKKD